MASEIDDLKKIVQDLASQVRSDRKIIMATQSFCTTLADELDLLKESSESSLGEMEEHLVKLIDQNRDRLLAIASGVTVGIRALGDAWDESRR